MFITFEGSEGAGKTTQTLLFAKRLEDELGKDVILTREPGGGNDLSKKLREIVLSTEMTLAAEFLLFAAARAEHVESLIRPALRRGKIVVCDRYLHSTLAMQGYAMGVPLDLIADVHSWSTGCLMPDLTFFIDLPPEKGLARQGDRNKMEERGIEYALNVYDGFLRVIKDDPSVIIVDGEGTVEEVHERIWLSILKDMYFGYRPPTYEKESNKVIKSMVTR